YLYVLHPSSPMHSSTLSLHDALPIYLARQLVGSDGGAGPDRAVGGAESSGRRAAAHGNRALIWRRAGGHLRKALSEDHACRRSLDRKSTRLNSSHGSISYAVCCLKKK